MLRLIWGTNVDDGCLALWSSPGSPLALPSFQGPRLASLPSFPLLSTSPLSPFNFFDEGSHPESEALFLLRPSFPSMLSLFFFPLEDFTAFNVPPYKTKFKGHCKGPFSLWKPQSVSSLPSLEADSKCRLPCSDGSSQTSFYQEALILWFDSYTHIHTNTHWR